MIWLYFQKQKEGWVGIPALTVCQCDTLGWHLKVDHCRRGPRVAWHRGPRGLGDSLGPRERLGLHWVQVQHITGWGETSEVIDVTERSITRGQMRWFTLTCSLFQKVCSCTHVTGWLNLQNFTYWVWEWDIMIHRPSLRFKHRCLNRHLLIIQFVNSTVQKFYLFIHLFLWKMSLMLTKAAFIWNAVILWKMITI